MQVLEIGGHQVIDGLLHALIRVPPQSIECAASALSSNSESLTAMTRLVLTVSLLCAGWTRRLSGWMTPSCLFRQDH